MAQGISELLRIKIILSELKLKLNDSMRLYCDNMAAISIAHNSVQYDKEKHIKIDRHFTKEKLTNDIFCTPFVKFGEQLADVLTKGVASRPYHVFLSKLGMRDIFAPS